MTNESTSRGKLISTKNNLEFEFTFEYLIKYQKEFNAKVYFFEIWDEKENIDKIYRYSYMLRIMENGNDLKVIDLFANRYIGKGIGSAIILKSKELFEKRIISSSNTKKSYPTESNWKAAIEKVWKPMMAKGLVDYNFLEDYYYTI